MPESQPNIILILTDDQGYGDLGCHGHPFLKTPALDKLHSESVRFTDFHVTPMCAPTRGSLMSGMDCMRNGAMATSLGRHLLRRELPTMADCFRGAGYRTGLFGKWHLGSSYPYRPMDRGFEEAIYHNGYGLTGVDDYWNNDYYDPWYRDKGELKKAEGYCTDFWFGEAMRWMEGCQAKGEPFFSYIATNVPHFPMWIEDVYKEEFAAYAGEDQGKDPAGFYGMIVQLDENMARLDKFLTERGLKENTILLYLTDNGHAGGALDIYNAGMRGGKCSRYEGGHRVPCFVRWPAGGLRSPGDVEFPAQGQDILPTLLDLCGVDAPPSAQFDGSSLAPAIRDESHDLDDRMFVVQYFQNDWKKYDACVVWRKWRLVLGKELYDLETDPGQKHNVIADHPEIAGPMQEFYEEWFTGVEPGLDTFSPLHVGSDAEPEVCLSSAEWMDVRSDGANGPRMLTDKSRTSGPWNLEIEKAGRYRVELRRYPREAGLALNEASPEFHAVAGSIEPGVPADIASAVLELNGIPVETEPEFSPDAITYEVDLPAGPARLRGQFRDGSGEDVCGVFYCYIRLS